MKKTITIATSLILALFLNVNAAIAQCKAKNEAFSGHEQLFYNLYYNWKFIWVKAGTASMSTTETSYRGQPAYRTSLLTQTSARVDKFFRMRDTLLVYATKDIVPLYYRKGSSEGKRYYVDEAWYSYPNGNCAVAMRHRHNSGKVDTEKKTYNHCVYDMLNIFLRARNYDTSTWKKGHAINVDITGGDELVKAKLVYRGTETIKADNKKKYNCIILSYIEKEDGKDKEIVRFFVTDDKRHIPIRLDLFLKFGSAKAFLSSMKL